MGLGSVQNWMPKMWNYNIIRQCVYGFILRTALCIWSVVQDALYHVKYTDLDYSVFHEGAKLVSLQRSPYESETYRYSPIIAYLLTPNVFFHPIYGKLLFCAMDVCVAYFVFIIVSRMYGNPGKALKCAKLWLFNPLPIIIATRGNSDSIIAFLILLTIHYYMEEKYVLSGALLGLCTHLRLYPIIFFPVMVISAGRDRFPRLTKGRVKLTFSFAFVLYAFTHFFYYIYGEKFLHQSFWYHIIRTDTKHNMSLSFYAQYLGASSFITEFLPHWMSRNLVNKVALCSQVVIGAIFTAKYRTRRHLPFCMFCLMFLFVIFNRVLTAQYFIWFLSLMPLVLPHVHLTSTFVRNGTTLWLIAFAACMGSAYALEFKGINTYNWIFISAIFFHAVNFWIFATLIKAYNGFSIKKKMD